MGRANCPKPIAELKPTRFLHLNHAPFNGCSVAEVKWVRQIDTEKTLQGNYVWFKTGLQF